MMINQYAPLSVAEADELARELTADRMHVRSAGDSITLCHDKQRLTVHLLPYQLNASEIERAVAENDPWPEY